jgi:hypothetical protein
MYHKQILLFSFYKLCCKINHIYKIINTNNKINYTYNNKIIKNNQFKIINNNQFKIENVKRYL